MLGDKAAQATVAVKDLKAARPFYEDILGLQPLPSDEPTVQGFKAGGSVVLLYESDHAGTNETTALTWSLGDAFEETVAELKAKGVVFEHYDMPGMTLEGDAHVADGMKVVWFKDPDGNILSLGNY